MLNIQIEETIVQYEDGTEEKKKYLIANGIPDEDSYYFKLGQGHPTATLYDEEVIDIFINNSFEEVGKYFSKFKYDLEVDWWENLLEISIYCNEYHDLSIPCIDINLQIQDWEHWSKPWSISSLAKEFEENVNKLGNHKIEYWQEDSDSVLNGFGLEFFPDNKNSFINTEIEFLLPILRTVLNSTIKNLLESIDTDSILTYFQFPEEIKTPSKQYLVYFTQFIADMGIIVDTEIKEELNHTLFKIIPKDKRESLLKIREVLDIYLNIPSDKNFHIATVNQTDIAVKQWEANVYHLKSQLSLAASIIQAKESTIEMLQIANYQYKQLLESHSTKKESSEEEIVKGVFALKKYEGTGFSVDFAELFRRLRRVVIKDENTHR